MAGIKEITEKWSVKCKINSWNEWNAIWISMVNCFFIYLHDLLLFVNLSILFMKIQPIWYFVWPPIWQSSDICIVQFQYLSTNSYFINCVELSWWQIPGMIHVTYIVCHGIKLCLVNVLEAACQLFNIFYMTLCLWQNVYRQSINRTRHRYIVDFKLVYCACNGIHAKCIGHEK